MPPKIRAKSAVKNEKEPKKKIATKKNNPKIDSPISSSSSNISKSSKNSKSNRIIQKRKRRPSLLKSKSSSDRKINKRFSKKQKKYSDKNSEKNSRIKRCAAWEFFKLIECPWQKEGKIFTQEYVECSLCPIGLKYKTKNSKNVTRFMRNHLKNVHKKQTIGKIQLINQQQFNQIIVKQICHNLIPFSFILKSQILKCLSMMLNLRIPSSSAEIKQNLYEIFQTRKKLLKQKLKEQKSQYTISIHGTSILGRRFYSVFLYDSYNKIYFLGLVREWNSQTSQNIFTHINQLLHEFGINLSQISYMISDSAANMRKVPKFCGWTHVRCLSHMFHNSIKKLLDQVDFYETDSQEDEQISQQSNSQEEPQQKTLKLKTIISKIRQTVKIIKKSSRLQDAYRMIVGDENKGITIDISIRWNSTLKMLKQYLVQQQNFIRLFKSQKISVKFISEEQRQYIQEFVSLLQKIQYIQMIIQDKKTNLISAQKCVLSLIQNISETKSNLYEEYLNIIKSKYQAHRSKQLISVGLYLKKGFSNYEKIKLTYQFPLLQVQEIQEFVKVNWQKQTTQMHTAISPRQSQIAILDSSEEDQNMMIPIQKELNNFKLKENLGNKLRNILNLIKNCPAQSVVNQRSFSILGRIFSKYRPRLKDLTIQAISFLHYNLE